MNKVKKQALLEKIDQEVKKARAVAQKRAATARRAKSFSRSQQGDRRYFEDADQIAQESLVNLLGLKREIENSLDKPAEEAHPVAFITIQEGGETTSFYFVTNSATLEGVQLLTPASPLGKAIDGKKEGDKFSYQIEKDGQKIIYSGQIKMIE
ncbi:MAG TPA: hypothetical protein VMX77_01925 [Candidatus Bathyarchaeia archaeon]|nr:hypothetical protein [Candidatus Bathyarchaeia archaeon]